MDRNLPFYDSIAVEYDSIMQRSAGDAWVRDAFHNFVEIHIPKTGWMLDFGCGTGTDALRYVQQGRHVLAYDNSPGMIVQLRAKASADIQNGTIIPFSGSWVEFKTQLSAYPRPETIVANFAVLNCINDLKSLFRLFSEVVTPAGTVIVSVLNPYFWKDKVSRIIRYGILRKQRNKHSLEMDTYMHSVQSIFTAAQPHFVCADQASVGSLISYSGRPHVWERPSSIAERFEQRVWRIAPGSKLGKFIFISFKSVV